MKKIIITLLILILFIVTGMSQIYYKFGASVMYSFDKYIMCQIEYTTGLEINDINIGVGYIGAGLYDDQAIYIQPYHFIVGNLTYLNNIINIDLMYLYNPFYSFGQLMIGYCFNDWFVNSNFILGLQLATNGFIGVGCKINTNKQ